MGHEQHLDGDEINHTDNAIFTEIAHKLSQNEHVCRFFGLSPEEIQEFISTFHFDNGFSVSPMFESVGYSNIDPAEDPCPHVKRSNLGTSRSALEHECQHGLHCLVGIKIFTEAETARVGMEMLISQVLSDTEFVRAIEQNGHPHQKELLTRCQQFAEAFSEGTWSPEMALQVSFAAPFLGALVYQHAYFVDPSLCEAVASFQNHGTAWLIQEYNHLVGRYLIPGHEDVFEGYNDPGRQEFFELADPIHKALMVRKATYRELNRSGYFSPAPIELDPKEVVNDEPDPRRA